MVGQENVDGMLVAFGTCVVGAGRGGRTFDCLCWYLSLIMIYIGNILEVKCFHIRGSAKQGHWTSGLLDEGYEACE